MKIILRVVVLLVALLVALNYFGYQQSFHIPWQSWLASFKHKANDLIPKSDSPEAKNTVKISKWTDDKGVVHYENRPVAGAKIVEVDPDKNVLPPAPIVKLPESEAESKPKTLNEEMEVLREAKKRQMDAIINN
jgi:hypothetical protein